MARAALIDIQDKWSGKEPLAIHIFRGRAGAYEFERTTAVQPEPGSSPGINGIDEFYVSLPLGLLNFRILNLPFSDREKLKTVIPFELGNLILEGSGEVVFDFIVLGGSEKSYDVLVIYIQKKGLGEVLTKLSALGVDPKVVTSLDLQSVLKGSDGDLAAHLLNPDVMTPSERIEAAARELSAHTFNLRTGPFAYTKEREKVTRNFRITAILLLLLFLVIDADLAFRLISAKRETASLKREMRTIYSGFFPEDKKITDELYQMRSHMREIEEKETLLLGVSPLRFLRDLSQRMVQGAKLDELTIDKDQVTMKGEAVSMEAVDRLKTYLSGFMHDVSISDMKTSVEGKIRFSGTGKARVP